MFALAGWKAALISNELATKLRQVPKRAGVKRSSRCIEINQVPFKEVMPLELVDGLELKHDMVGLK
jgi:hypothetical protein